MAEFDPQQVVEKLESHFGFLRLPLEFANVFAHENIAAACKRPDFAEILPKLEGFCREITKAREELPHGYKIGFEKEFRYKPEIAFVGLYLIMRDPAGKTVGALGFSIGFPLEIHTVQGIKGGAPRKFYQATGGHFDETLIDKFISVAGRHFRPKKGKNTEPRIVFTQGMMKALSQPAKNRIVRKYCPRGAVMMLAGIRSREPRKPRVRGRAIAKAARRMRKPI